jgi:hypothetical protein
MAKSKKKKGTPTAHDQRALLVSLYKKFAWADALHREYDRYEARDRDFMRSGLENKAVRLKRRSKRTCTSVCGLACSMLLSRAGRCYV